MTPYDPPQIPVKLGPSIASIARNLTMEEFAALLSLAREEVRKDIIGMRPGTIGTDRLRDLAVKLQLPPRLKAQGKHFAVVAEALTVAGVAPVIGPAATILGGLIAISTVLWSGKLPRSATKVEWLHWAYEWDIERQRKESTL